MEKSITLNLSYDLPDSEWEKVSAVYKEMDGWVENAKLPCWYGTENDKEFICASVEPGGLLIAGTVSDMLWLGWVSKLCAKLTLALGREIYDAEM